MWQFQGLEGGRVYVDERLVLEVFPKGVRHGVLNVANFHGGYDGMIWGRDFWKLKL